ncbi:hypothetical protein MAR_018809 [Mya arenaria]|uniref:Uncharacterized protein n=1 Tax=Mya arenaria TaxID=6604 RepID=A0ABY7EJ87_MYAAR|nr:hypothetical protein MAR_018809 [Mya arenaria]
MNETRPELKFKVVYARQLETYSIPPLIALEIIGTDCNIIETLLEIESNVIVDEDNKTTINRFNVKVVEEKLTL